MWWQKKEWKNRIWLWALWGNTEGRANMNKLQYQNYTSPSSSLSQSSSHVSIGKVGLGLSLFPTYSSWSLGARLGDTVWGDGIYLGKDGIGIIEAWLDGVEGKEGFIDSWLLCSGVAFVGLEIGSEDGGKEGDSVAFEGLEFCSVGGGKEGDFVAAFGVVLTKDFMIRAIQILWAQGWPKMHRQTLYKLLDIWDTIWVDVRLYTLLWFVERDSRELGGSDIVGRQWWKLSSTYLWLLPGLWTGRGSIIKYSVWAPVGSFVCSPGRAECVILSSVFAP